ncbi:hypothetical protein MtrunA17_Chr6g0485541 [Medicago truncatula]|uniref:Uncharacterized protein n=1 Tax=Medicago truncatula TaxID=3880 RepID=A0A396HJW2_MEDTR|nr:hypothetical protein MtrunA17_Chr6g0485541 [Medicago truncatula]
MDNEDVGRTRRGKEALHASVPKEQVPNAPPRRRGRGRGRGRGRREELGGSSSQSQIDIEMPSSQSASGSQPPSVGVVQEGYDGGPSNMSLLPSFGQHIAAKIWNGGVLTIVDG